MIYIVTFIIVVLIVLWGINVYLMKIGKLTAWDWQLNALGLPRGSVRAMLAIGFVATLIICAIEGIHMPDLPEWAVGIMGSIVGFYFGAASTRPPRHQEQPNEK